MHGSDREFACMKRIVSILCPEFDEPPAPARFTKTFHVYQEDMTSAPVRHHQAISNAHVYAGSCQTRWIHGKCICIQFVGADRSNLWSDFGLHETCMVAPPPTDAEFAPRFHDRLHLFDPTHPKDGYKA